MFYKYFTTFFTYSYHLYITKKGKSCFMNSTAFVIRICQIKSKWDNTTFKIFFAPLFFFFFLYALRLLPQSRNGSESKPADIQGCINWAPCLFATAKHSSVYSQMLRINYIRGWMETCKQLLVQTEEQRYRGYCFHMSSDNRLGSLMQFPPTN